MQRKIAQTGSRKPGVMGTRTGSATASGWLIQASPRVVCIGTLKAAENGLVTVSAASCSSLTDAIPCRYY